MMRANTSLHYISRGIYVFPTTSQPTSHFTHYDLYKIYDKIIKYEELFLNIILQYVNISN